MKQKSLRLTAMVTFTMAAAILLPTQTMAQNVPSYVPTNGLVGWWPFTGNAIDSSGNNNNGSVNGATLTSDRSGNSNAAYSFSGSSWIQVSNQFFPTNIASGYTLSGWVFNPSTPSREVIFSYYDCSPFCRGIETTIDNDTLITAIRQNNTIVLFTKYRIPSTINWFFVTVTFSNGQLKSYINGILVNSVTNTAITSINMNSEKLNFGVLKSTSFNPPILHLTGKIDDIGFWSRALTPCEITTLYNSSIASTASITANGSTNFCQGDSVTLTASSGASYLWSNGATSQSITVNQGNIYTVTITDSNNCNATASQAVTVNSLPNNTVNVSGATTFCSGGSVTLTAQGTGTYLWSNGSNNQSITVNQTNSFVVTVTSANNCSASSSPINVIVNQTPTASISASGNTTFCQGGSVTLTGNGGLNYNWSNSSTSQSITVSNGGVYSVTVSNGNCTATASQNITVNSNPSVSFSLPTIVSTTAPAFNMNGNPSGGTYTGAGVSGSSFNPSTAGLGLKQVYYTYSNVNGCSGSASSTTLVYDTTGNVCTSYDTTIINETVYDTVTITVNDTVTTYLSVTDTLKIDVNLTGINPPNNSNLVTVYPNPTKDHLLINCGNYISMNGYSMKITNSLGQIVFIQPVTQQQFYIDLSTWGGAGTYILYVIDTNQTVKSQKQIVLQ